MKTLQNKRTLILVTVVLPDTVLIFFSRHLVHEGVPSHRPRIALTIHVFTTLPSTNLTARRC